MALTNTQYNTIMRIYEQRQTRHRHLREERTRYVYENVEGYRNLDESTASLSVSQGRKLLSGDRNAVAELHERLALLSADKLRLLKEHGLPEDYLAPGYDCPDCKDTGYVNGRKCHCFRQAEISLLYEQSHLSERLAEENFDMLSLEYHEGDNLNEYRQVVERCRRYAEDFASHRSANLFLYGTVGTGKTFLSNCIAKALLDQGFAVIYFSSASLFDTLARNTYDYKGQSQLEALYSDLYGCDLLVIDDLGAEQTTNLALSHFFTILNERMNRGKATLISTNLSVPMLQERYQDRIFSRITSKFEFCKLTGPDIRMQKKFIANRK